MIQKALRILFLSCGFWASAQITVNTPITTTQTIENPVSVSLMPGFSVTANPNLSFIARIANDNNDPVVVNNTCGEFGKIVISEVFFDTRYNEQIESKYHHFGEYIELFNSSNVPVDLTGWIIRDNHTSFKFTTNSGHNTDLIIQPGGYKIVTYNGFYASGYYSPAGTPSAIGGRSKFIELFPETGTITNVNDIILQNTMVLFNIQDEVALYSPSGKLIDEIRYYNSGDPNTVTDDKTYNIVPLLDNGDGGNFNGPMGAIPALNANGEIILDENGNPIYTQHDEFKKAIFRSNVDAYYSNATQAVFQVATASPFSIPQLTIPLKDLDPFLFSPINNNLNSTESIVYDIKDGSVIAQSKTYFDDLGKPTVSLSKDFANNRVWGSETAYDTFGRKSMESFPAPTCMDFNNINFLSNPIAKAAFLDKYYSNNNLTEVFQATAEQTYSEINYDNLNPGNVISVVGGNKIDAEWKTGFSYTVPAAQEMYYAFGSGHFYDNRDVNNYTITNASKVYPEYDLLGLTAYKLQTVYSDTDLSAPPYTTTVTGTHFFDLKANSPLEIGKIYKVLMYGTPCYVQILEQLGPFRNTQNIWASMKILEGSWSNFTEINEYNAKDEIQLVLNDTNKIIAGLKAFKSIGIDANGIENVSFTDSDGKVLAAARSGLNGSPQYPVTSLIGQQGFVDIHLPKYCDGTLTYIGGASLYNVYNLRGGNLLTDSEKANLLPGVYRVALKINTRPLPLTYINKTTGLISNVSSHSKGVNYKVNYYDYSLNIYNKIGQLIKSVQPNGYTANTTIVAAPSHMTAAGFATSYAYNDQGQVKEATSADEGTSKFLYRQDGQIRYSQSALQADTKVSYTDYDEYARPIESGVIKGASGIWAVASSDPDGPLIAETASTPRSERTFTVYDYDDQSALVSSNLTLNQVLSSAGISTANYVQQNLSGNVAITYGKKAVPINAITWYSYDTYGRVTWIVQYNEGFGAKTTHYYYDYKGNVKKVIFQKDNATELFVHRYTYDLNDILKKVETSTDNSTFVTHADYDYYATGELKRVDIAQGAQGLDYVYTLGGQLKSINHPSLEQAKDPGHDANDVFGITLDYHNGDYLRSGTNIASSPTIAGTNQDFNGNIKAARWGSKGVPGDFNTGTSVVNQKAYQYNYNRNNWLTEATFGTTNNTGTITANNMYKEGALTYDANGNIKTLQRANDTGTITDNLTYQYTNAGKNQLNHVAEAAAATADATDIENQAADNYLYDAIGQMTRNVKEDLYYFYNTQGLVTEVRKGGQPIIKMYYNERGQRVRKENFNPSSLILKSTDYYALDISGNTLAVYNKPATTGVTTQQELPIYGLSRLGVYIKDPSINPDYMNYQIADHLGNVRAVIKKIVGNPVILIASYADYYPFGEQLPERNSMNGYRYAYQGQELDGETGMEAFQLRLWDGRLGRWLSPDPMGQYASPYLGMGNNPVSRIDPDGGQDGDPGKGFWGRIWGGITSFFGGSNEVTYAGNNGQPLPEVVLNRSVSSGGGNVIGVSGYSVDYGALGSTRDGGLALPQDFGSWNSAGSDGRQWIGCMACHGDNGAYRSLAYDSPSRVFGLGIAALLPIPGITRIGATKTNIPLYHYTTEAGYNAIMKSKVLNPSIGAKNARFGSGQYFTDIAPGTFTKGQTSYRLYGVPWNGSKLTHYIKIESSGLKIINNKPFNFLNPSSSPLNLNGRILGGGATGF